MAHIQIGRLKDVTPSDVTELEFDWVYVTVTGSLRITHQDGSVTDLAAAPVGMPIPMENGVKVNSTGTSATGIMVV